MNYEIPYADPITEQIDLYCRTWEDLMRQRVRFTNRGIDPITGEVRAPLVLELGEKIIGRSEEKVKRELGKLVREHPMGDWLQDAKTAGARVGTVLTIIRNPHRFPGQRCAEGHYTLPTFEVGDPCPCGTVPEKDGEPEPCEGTMEAPRRGTGCRAVWHMFGLYPQQVNGTKKLASYRKGQQGSHNVRGKTAILMPQGIAQQFYMQGSRYAEVYYEEKARLADRSPEKAPGWLDTTARVIAAKVWLGDLLMEWKRQVPLENFR